MATGLISSLGAMPSLRFRFGSSVGLRAVGWCLSMGSAPPMIAIDISRSGIGGLDSCRLQSFPVRSAGMGISVVRELFFFPTVFLRRQRCLQNPDRQCDLFQEALPRDCYPAIRELCVRTKASGNARSFSAVCPWAVKTSPEGTRTIEALRFAFTVKVHKRQVRLLDRGRITDGKRT